ncbi:peptidyl-tRNA hydrolase [Xylona heveae TC161]|uniref:peptidyl-tRNA hydrolase n=1 Tax=Xylona heveae (strain CBS 132557 / TC161) TaxID=1328760 RepID=A0A165GU77_XYLHT|nr:peptidyl-tRNA hydrolase [Xylona heveae TC161]KZF22603.1 peptidyl-tRNA hydrolase [Xylona heveae TC161]
MAAPRRLHLLVASLGNPPPTYTNTLHSAGHTVLHRLREILAYPEFHKESSMGGGLVTRSIYADHNPKNYSDSNFTLWQSPSLMNTSGKVVSAAWKTWTRRLKPGEEGKLVILHDELEGPLGRVKLKIGGSARGHNGIKSCIAAMPNHEFARIGIGIGRPESRESKDVARYVLRKMNEKELYTIEESAGEVLQIIRDLVGE